MIPVKEGEEKKKRCKGGGCVRVFVENCVGVEKRREREGETNICSSRCCGRSGWMMVDWLGWQASRQVGK